MKKQSFAPPGKPQKSGAAGPALEQINTLLALLDQGNIGAAEPMARGLTHRFPQHGLGWQALGVVFNSQGRIAEAIDAMRKAARVLPGDAQAHYNLAAALHGQGDLAEAEALYQKALKIQPAFAHAHNNLGLLRLAQTRPAEAEACFRLATGIQPLFAQAHNHLGVALIKQHRFPQAEASFRQALEAKPDFAEAHNNLSIALNAQRRLGEAEQHCRMALAIKPGYVDAHNNLGKVLIEQDRLEQGLASFRQAVALNPDSAELHKNTANALKMLGRLDAALDSYRKALTLTPGHVSGWNDILLAMVYAAAVPPADLAAASRQFGQRFADPLRRRRGFAQGGFAHPRETGRKLKIGYVSGDLRNHAVSYFIEPVLQAHQRSQFALVAYASSRIEDAVSERLKPHFDHWRNIADLDDAEAADLIEADGIDILVDLSGHTGGNRLLVFAKKPAPVQATWLGYPATTGMAAMDYRITDVHSEPPGMSEQYNVETLWRLPDVFCCYRAPDTSPDVAARPPLQDNGFITFGCFNNFSKVTDPVIALWAVILLRTPGARLMLEIQGVAEATFRADVERRFARCGVGAEMLILIPRERANQYILYNKIDIALDPFPCNGGTTSFDTLWMGVPLVTLAGKHFVSRMGVTLATNAGLAELVAQTEDEYADIAVALATDPARLERIRCGLRQRVQASPLMDAERFTRNLEQAYRAMWQNWLDRADEDQPEHGE